MLLGVWNLRVWGERLQGFAPVADGFVRGLSGCIDSLEGAGQVQDGGFGFAGQGEARLWLGWVWV